MRETQDYIDFSITSWLDKFKSVTLKTVIIDIPIDVWIKVSDGDKIHEITESLPLELKNQIKNVIKTFNNKAFVKNNWHAPTDAKLFSLGNILQVDRCEDIFMFLTMSTIVQRDLDYIEMENIEGLEFCIALKEWKNIHPASEFRCIVVGNVLRGITPRDWPTFYAHFNEEGPQIIKKTREFFNEHIKTKFPRENYIFDIVMSFSDGIYLLDFSPLNRNTVLYAFSWSEIQPLLNKEPEDVAPVFRFLEKDIGLRPKQLLHQLIAAQTN
ncbi:unnamed protein product [Brassicogethes aeneus]|uniref:Cell division cycle protein 123 homolog n=1 Tax=Brassicogethes aeneus TaxID=1431903 RepID=A0A9P0BC95_BRAAE|nr:unnamed protein product [Brassicogethes aeneus]